MGERGTPAGSSQGSPPRGWPVAPLQLPGRGHVSVAEKGGPRGGGERQARGCGAGSARPGSPPGGWAGGKGPGCRAGGTEPGCLRSTARAAAGKLLDPPARPGGGRRSGLPPPLPGGGGGFL